MRFGETFVLKTAKGKLGVGIAMILFGVFAVLAAPTALDKLLCGIIILGGAALFVLGFRQDRADKSRFRDNEAKR